MAINFKALRSLTVLFFFGTAMQFMGQQPSPGRVVEGTVSDPSGAAIVGAQVTLRDGQGHPLRQVTTDGAGHFRFPSVSAAASRVEATLKDQGFRDASIPVKEHGPLHITMEIASVNEEVAVGENAAAVNTDTAQNQNSNSLDRSTLDRIPVFDQDYIAAISQFLDQGALATGGVTLIVNGMEANGAGVTASAIREVKINQNPFSALYSRPGRARIEITTKSGTPNFHGTLNFLFRDAAFDASNRFAAIKPPEQRRYYEGSVTGPISRDKKTTFLAALDYDSDDQEAFVVADTPSGAVRQNVPTPMTHLFGSGRIFHSFSDTHNSWIGYSYEERTTDNQGVGGTTLASAATTNRFQEHEINVGDTKAFSPRWLNQLRFLIGHENAPITSNVNAPRIVVLDSFVSGGAQADSKRTEAHFEGTDTVIYTSGRSELKFGAEVPDLSRRGADDFSNRLGTYTFASVADYLAGRPQTLLFQRGQGHLVFLEKNFAGFVEDTFRFRPNFTLTLGLRYYWQNFFHDDANNFAPRLGFAWSPGAKRKTVVRGGAGVFYDRTGPRPIADLLHFDGSTLRPFLINDPLYDPTCPCCTVTNAPTSIVTLARSAIIPYTVQWSLGVERQITSRSSLGAN